MGWSHFSSSGTLKTVGLNVQSSVDIPVGSIQVYAGTAVPSGWLFCNGDVVSRTSYSDLFAAIGTSYGAGDGSTTFGVPDLRGKIPVGKNTGTFASLGGTGGAETHSLTQAQLADHAHATPFQNTAGTGANGMRSAWNDSAYGLTSGTSTFANYSTILDNGTYAVGSSSTFKNYLTGGVYDAGGADGAAHNILQPYQVVNYIIKSSNVAGSTAIDFQAARAKYYTSASTALSAGVDTKVALAIAGMEYDTDGFLNDASDRLVVPAGMAGLYRISGQVLFNDATKTGNRQVQIRKGGTAVAEQAVPVVATGNNTQLQVGVDLELIAGDYLELWANSTDVNTVTSGVNNTWLSLQRVSGAPTPLQNVPNSLVTNGYATLTSNNTNVGTGTILTSITVTGDSSRMMMIEAHVGTASLSTTGDRFDIYIKDGASELVAGYSSAPGVNYFMGPYHLKIRVPAFSGSKTFNLYCVRGVGAGTGTVSASSINPTWIQATWLT